MQFQYSNYEGMGVPISREILNRSQRPSNDDSFPYLEQQWMSTKVR
jgi:hypothetical protein